MTASTAALPLIFTDLDGTLLDHDSYSFAPALPALSMIRERGYPLIFCSSKTRAEIHHLQHELDIEQPFVCENGAAVFLPPDNGHDWSCHRLGEPRDAILACLAALRRRGFKFSGFNDWSLEEISARTGLVHEAAARAAKREFSEPITWEDSAERLDEFRSLLSGEGLRTLQGGRFLSIMGHFDKADGLQWLVARYAAERPVLTVALGDSPNDEQMLNAADIAVIIRSERSTQISLHRPSRVVRTVEPGPVGWRQAISDILADYD